ncbi:MAG: DNA-binding protein [Sphingobacterium sp.]|jgi:hypothetical protein|nr:DNA-binding protein [Sphingobacterium sp.]
MNTITKEDLDILKEDLLSNINEIVDNKLSCAVKSIEFDWLRSKAIRRLMDISPSTLQNLRITGKVGYRKIMGSYYYNKTDLLNLFK